MSPVPSRSEALSRHRDEMLRRRQLAKMVPAGGLNGRAGIVAPPQFLRNGGVDQQIVAMNEPEGESIPVDQPGPMKIAQSNKYPLRSGGYVTLVITLKTALTAPGEVQLLHNETVFATEAVLANDDFQIIGPWPNEFFAAGDTIQLAITNAGSGGSGFHAELRFS